MFRLCFTFWPPLKLCTAHWARLYKWVASPAQRRVFPCSILYHVFSYPSVILFGPEMSLLLISLNGILSGGHLKHPRLCVHTQRRLGRMYVQYSSSSECVFVCETEEDEIMWLFQWCRILFWNSLQRHPGSPWSGSNARMHTWTHMTAYINTHAQK